MRVNQLSPVIQGDQKVSVHLTITTQKVTVMSNVSPASLQIFIDRARVTGGYRVLVGKPEGKGPLGRTNFRWKDNIKIDLQKVGCGVWTGLNWLRLEVAGKYKRRNYDNPAHRLCNYILYDIPPIRFAFQVTQKDLRSSLMMAGYCRNM
jgi:hypothetical protein